MTLIANRRVLPAPEAGAAFATPSVVRFGVVLLLAAMATVPWNGIAAVAAPWGVVGLGGIVYSAVVTRLLKAQTAYQPVSEDWWFHVVLPFEACALLAGAAFAAFSHARPASLAVGAAVLLLLFIGIHNAWDAVTYHVFVKRREEPGAERHPEAGLRATRTQGYVAVRAVKPKRLEFPIPTFTAD